MYLLKEERKKSAMGMQDYGSIPIASHAMPQGHSLVPFGSCVSPKQINDLREPDFFPILI
jgi:hypothetical protein